MAESLICAFKGVKDGILKFEIFCMEDPGPRVSLAVTCLELESAIDPQTLMRDRINRAAKALPFGVDEW